MKKTTTLYHLIFKNEVVNKNYYSSLTALYEENEEKIGVSKGTLDRWKWENDYKNDLVIIIKSELRTARMVREDLQQRLKKIEENQFL